MSGFDELWVQAVQRYEKLTERDLNKEDNALKLCCFADLEKAVNESSVCLETARNRHKGLTEPFRKCLGPLEPILQLTEAGVGMTPFAPAGLIFGASLHLLQSCKGVSECYDGLESLLERVAGITTRLARYTQTPSDEAIRESIVKILADIMVMLGTAEKIIKRKRFKTFLRQVFVQEDELEESVASLERHVEAEQHLLTQSGYVAITQTNASIGQAHRKLDGLQESTKRAAAAAAEEKLDRLLEYSSSEKNFQTQVNHEDTVVKGTGQWLRYDNVYESWIKRQCRLLWVMGGPGTGKSTLAAQTIKLLESPAEDAIDPSRPTVAYFYFRTGNTAQQECGQMIKSVLRQISQKSPAFKQALLKRLPMLKEYLATPSRAWRDLLVEFFTLPRRSDQESMEAVIVLDGLDEADPQEQVQVLSCLNQLVMHSERPRLRVVTFCRPDVSAHPLFEEADFVRHSRFVRVTDDSNRREIETFARVRVKEVRLLRTLMKQGKVKATRQHARSIINEVVGHSGGMFLWAKLVFDSITEASSATSLYAAIRETPADLHGVIQQAFRQLNDREQKKHDTRYLATLFAVVLSVDRPLTIAEIFLVLYLCLGQKYYELEHDLRTSYASILAISGPEPVVKSDPLSSNGSIDSTANSVDDRASVRRDSASMDKLLDDLDLDSDADNASDETDLPAALSSTLEDIEKTHRPLEQHWYTQTVQFSHASFKEVLVDQRHKQTWHDCHHVIGELRYGHLRMASACLDVAQKQYPVIYEVDNLYQYARMNWIEHLSKISLVSVPAPEFSAIVKSVVHFFREGETFRQSVAEAGDHFWRTWVHTNKNVEVVQDVMRQALPDLDEQDQEWARQAATSTKVLFGPVCEACARKWLCRPGWNDPIIVDKRQDWMRMIVGRMAVEQGDLDLVCSLHGDNNDPVLPAAQILAAAEYVPLDHDAFWHTGVGFSLYQNSRPEDLQVAKDHFNTAIEKAPDAWLPHEGLATCHNGLFDYSSALVEMEKAIELLPRTGMEWLEIWLLEHIVEFALWNRRHDEALTWGKKAFEKDPRKDTVNLYFTAIMRAGHRDTYVDALEQLSRLDADGTILADRLRLFYSDVFDFQYDVVKTPSLRSRLFTLYRRKVFLSLLRLESFETTHFWMVLAAADLICDYEVEGYLDNLVPLLMKTLRLIEQLPDSLKKSEAQRSDDFSNRLSDILLREAISAQDAGTDDKFFLDGLRGISESEQQSITLDTRFAMLARVILQRDGRCPDSPSWKILLTPTIKSAVAMLNDNDPLNDQTAYLRLGEAFHSARYLEDARIAFGLSFLHLYDATRSDQKINMIGTDIVTDSQPQNHFNERYKGFEDRFFCDGCNEPPKTQLHELHACRLCRYIGWCSVCLPRLRARTLDKKLCSPDHVFLQIWPMSLEAQRISDGILRRDFQPLEAWLNHIKQEWQV